MTIAEAKSSLKKIKEERIADTKVKKRIDALIGDLDELFANVDEIDKYIVNTIEYADSDTGSVDYNWVISLHEMFLQMKHRMRCQNQLQNQLNKNKGKIDGETSQWVTTAIQSVLGIASAIFTILFALGIIPNVFGVLGENQNTDAFYYIIGTIVQQLVALVVGIIIGIINKHRIKKYENNGTYGDSSFEELLAFKYADRPKMLWLLSPTARKMRDCQFAHGPNIRQSQGNKAKAKSGGKAYQNAGDVTVR